MHQVDKFIHFTPLKEEPSIIQRLVQAVAQRRLNTFQSRTLEIVYRYMIEENRNLLLDTFNNFRQVLSQLEIAPPELHERMVEGRYRGSRPRVPDPKKSPQKYQEHVEKRGRKRHESFEHWLHYYRLSREDFEQLLKAGMTMSRVETKIDSMRASVDKNFAEVMKLLGLDETADAREVKKTLLKLVVDNTKTS